jgi:uncharacterized protein YdiU (UPF0061 family)
MFWNLQQLAATFTLVAERDALVEALNGFSSAYRAELVAAMLARLGVGSRSVEGDIDLINAAFRALASGDGERLRWEPFFFDWFCGDEPRAMAGPRADLYQAEGFTEFRRLLALHEPVRGERLEADYFRRSEPEELLYDEIEAIWARIAEADDWSAFHAKLAAIDGARQAYQL